jgi:hypothetical protein
VITVASQEKKTDIPLDPELEHLEKAKKSGLVSHKEYGEAKRVLQKNRKARDKKKKDAVAKDKAVEAIVGQPLSPRKKGSGKYFMKVPKPKVSKPSPKKEDVKKPVKKVKKGSKKKVASVKKKDVSKKAVVKKPVNKVETIAAPEVLSGSVIESVAKPSYVDTVQSVDSSDLVQASDNSLRYKDLDPIAEDQETNWRLGLAVLTIFLLILLYVKFTSFGAVGNAVVVDAYLDYSSSYSHETYNVLQEITVAYGENVFIDYHFIGSTGQSVLASAAVSCASDLDKEYAYQSYLFDIDSASWSTSSDLVAFAEELDLDVGLFELCLTSDMKDAYVDREIAAAEELGIDYTPTLLVNNKKIVGDVGYDAIVSVIDAELNILG